MSGWVREGGQIVACVPNVQHYSVLVNLLRGKWEYSDEGLLDRTHLRFFTLSGIQDLFARAGLQVFEIQPRSWPHTEHDRFLQVMASVASALAIDPKAFAIQTQAVQYIVRAVRGIEPLRRTVIWSLLGSVVGSEVRVGRARPFPRDGPRYSHTDRDRSPVRGTRPDVAGGGESIRPAARDHPTRRSYETTTRLARAGISHRRRIR